MIVITNIERVMMTMIMIMIVVFMGILIKMITILVNMEILVRMGNKMGKNTRSKKEIGAKQKLVY